MVTPICQVCLTIIYNDVGPFSIMNFESSIISDGEENFGWIVFQVLQKKILFCFSLFSTNAYLFIFRFSVRHIGWKILSN